MSSRLMYLLATGLFLLVAILPVQTRADMTFHFTRITPYNEDLSKQLTVTVLSSAPTGKVAFEFTNPVGIESSIADIYFYDGVYISGEPIIESSLGVVFDTPAIPGDLPGYNKPPTYVLAASADSDKPISANGIDAAGEWLKLTYDLFAGNDSAPAATYESVVSGIQTGRFVIGLHVQSIGVEGESDSYVTFVPVPAAVLLGMLGLGCAGMKLRKLV